MPKPNLFLAFLVSAVSALVTNPATAFVVDDIVVCAPTGGAPEVIDPEFDETGMYMVYLTSTSAGADMNIVQLLADGTNSAGTLNCGVPRTDTADLFDFGGGLPGFFFANGPEFARSANGLEIFYTKVTSGVPSLMKAWLSGGSWATLALSSGTKRGAVVTSHEPTDPQARLFYVQDTSTTTTPQYEADWREANAATDAPVPNGLSTFSVAGGAPRWVQATGAAGRALSLTVSSAGAGNCGRQAAQYFIDTGAIDQITACRTVVPPASVPPGARDETWVWSAPEFGGDLAAITVTNGNCLEVYRKTGGAWGKIQSFLADATVAGITTDCDMTTSSYKFYSPEIKVVNGHSYIAVQRSGTILGTGHIWVLAADPASTYGTARAQNINAAGPLVRTEPEWYVTSLGAYVFYTARTSSTGPAYLKRAATGI